MMPIAESKPARVDSPSTSVSTRIVSLDALRGFDMFWILGADQAVWALPKIHDSSFTRGLATQMEHCEWAGFHFYDLIFPMFVFIVGISITFSVSRMLERDGMPKTVRRIVFRSIILFLLGVFYMGGIAEGFSKIYFTGVLHRIAVAYFFAALMFCFFRTRTLIFICAALLIGYWALLTFVPVPDAGAPSLAEPGHNLAHYLDDQFLPGQRFEGTLLSTMAAVANCLLGVFAGLLLKNNSLTDQQKVRHLAIAGIISLLLGYAWSWQFPIIKLLWTSSYVLVACGYSALLMALFHQIIEVWQFRAWAQPFIWIGTNALTIYIIANIVNFRRLATRFIGGDISVLLGSYSDLVTAIAAVTLALCFVNFLYRKQIFLRL